MEKTPYVRMLVILLVYSLVLLLSFWVAFLLRFEFQIPADQWAIFQKNCLWFVPLKLMVLLSIGQFAGLLSFFSIPDLRRVCYGLLATSAGMLVLWHWQHGVALPPRSVVVADFVFALVGLSASRLVFRMIRERLKAPSASATHGQARRVGIIGAGYVGAALARDLMTKRDLGLHPVAFFDDERGKWRSRVHNIPVVGPPESILSHKAALRLDEIVIAMPSAPAKRMREIVQALRLARIKFTTVPSLDQLATGLVVSQLREVDIEDLLGREPVALDRKDIRLYLAGRTVMVTGAGGSIGQELCRQIAEFGPRQLLLVDQSEVQLFQIEQKLIELGHGAIIQPLIADIMDAQRMRYIFTEFRPAVIFHAAAHKHVPMMEHQPMEAVKNNTFGSARLADLAAEYDVERFVFISTDKAINPTNVMGASKRLAELYLQAFQDSDGNRTRFIAVRFGNVLGSSGSVVPIFKRQIAAGGPVRVTHPEVTRYFMTIPEAAGLVLQSGAQGKGGEIFVLDMGKPVKIADLARTLIELSGLKPGDDIEIQYVGLRPGEKLYEEVRHGMENLASTTHPKILRLISTPLPLYRMQACLQELEQSLYQVETNELKLLLKKTIPEYTPWLQRTSPVPAKLRKPQPVAEPGSQHDRAVEQCLPRLTPTAIELAAGSGFPNPNLNLDPHLNLQVPVKEAG